MKKSTKAILIILAFILCLSLVPALAAEPVNQIWDIESVPALSLVAGDSGSRLRVINCGDSEIIGSVFAASYAADGRMTGCTQLSAEAAACSVSFIPTDIRPEGASVGLFLLDSEGHTPLLPASVQNFE